MAELNIGRSKENDIVFNDSSVSRKHCTIIISGTDFFVRDNSSANGTYINGHRITGTSPLKPNEILKIGNVVVPWRNYLEALKASPNIKKNNSANTPKVSSPTKIVRKKDNSALWIMYSIAGVIIIFSFFVFMKNNTDKRRILGTWNCDVNCRDVTQISFEVNDNENQFRWKYSGWQTIRGNWSIDESTKEIKLIPVTEENRETQLFKYELKNTKLNLTRYKSNGNLENAEMELIKE